LPSLRRRSSSSRQIVVDREDVVDHDHPHPDASPATRGREEFDFVIRLPMDRTLTLRASNQVWLSSLRCITMLIDPPQRIESVY
jgi:hypothetical protein